MIIEVNLGLAVIGVIVIIVTGICLAGRIAGVENDAKYYKELYEITERTLQATERRYNLSIQHLRNKLEPEQGGVPRDRLVWTSAKVPSYEGLQDRYEEEFTGEVIDGEICKDPEVTAKDIKLIEGDQTR